jgi:hypothetical protein
MNQTHLTQQTMPNESTNHIPLKGYYLHLICPRYCILNYSIFKLRLTSCSVILSSIKGIYCEWWRKQWDREQI